MTGTRPALFLDRDGVVNRDIQYLHRIEECQFIDGIFPVTAAFAARGYAIVIACNQSGIARGLYTEADFARLMDWMRMEFSRHGSRIDAVYYASTHPSEGIGPFRRESSWRKPGPGMYLQAARDLGLDLAGSVSIGNQATDIEAGRAAGIGTLVLFDSDAATVEPREGYWQVPRLADMLDLAPAAIAT
jgi:D-glycero-D-manno-heptose 1,7-bisphosphate phosphatase